MHVVDGDAVGKEIQVDQCPHPGVGHENVDTTVEVADLEVADIDRPESNAR